MWRVWGEGGGGKPSCLQDESVRRGRDEEGEERRGRRGKWDRGERGERGRGERGRERGETGEEQNMNDTVSILLVTAG